MPFPGLGPSGCFWCPTPIFPKTERQSGWLSLPAAGNMRFSTTSNRTPRWSWQRRGPHGSGPFNRTCWWPWAKAMAYFAKGDYKVVAIPTTSGSGSEVTDFAILTHNRVKHPLVDRRLRPDMAILESDLLQELPKGLIAESGFDVLCHAADSSVAKNAGTITDLYAREAFSGAYAALPASFAGNKKVRLKVHLCATMAGMAFTQSGLGLCHAMAHTLGGMFHVPHGRLNAILLPSVISCNAHVAGKKYAELARAAGMGGSADTIAVRNLKNGLIRLRRELNLPETLVQAGVDPRSLWRNVEEIVKSTLEDPCCDTNPMPAEGFLVRRILEEVTGRV